MTSEETVNEEFRIVIEAGTEAEGLEMPGKIDISIWNWIKQGSKSVLDLSTAGLAETAEIIRSRLEDNLEGEWEVAEMSLTVSVSPAVNILIKTKG